MSFEDPNVPEMAKFRSVVEQISKRRDRVLIQTLYLACARVSEVITKVEPYELKHKSTAPYGRELTWKLDKFENERVLLLRLRVAKRRGKIFKIIGIPCSPKFEPWTLSLLKHIRDYGTLSFNLTRQRVRQIVREHLGGFNPFTNKTRPDKKVRNPLRHWRITHLVTEYDFSPYEITAYSGWTFKSSFGRMGMSSGQLDSYLHVSWKKYMPKLLKPIEVWLTGK